MKRWRTLRAIVTSSILWAGAWGLVGGALTLARFLLHPHPHGIWKLTVTVLASAGVASVWGAIAGVAFALALLRLRRRPRRSGVSLARWISWGALAGATVPGLAVTLAWLGSSAPPPLEPWWLVFPTVGAVTAAAIARLLRTRSTHLDGAHAAAALPLPTWSVVPVARDFATESVAERDDDPTP